MSEENVKEVPGMTLEEMCEKYTKSLENIKKRYGWKTIVNHFGDCSIYRAIDMHGFKPCTCGLIDDLSFLTGGMELVNKIYPKYLDDWVYKDVIWEPAEPGASYRYKEPKKPSPEEMEMAKKLLDKVFGKRILRIMIDHDAEWQFIEEIFGEKDAALMKKRYEECFEEEK